MDIGIYNILMILIATFNKDVSISDLKQGNTIYDFLKNNSNCIYDTFAYIEYYEELLNRLNQENFDCDNMYNNCLLSPDVIELLLYYDKKSKEEIQLLLVYQRDLLSKYFKVIGVMLATFFNRYKNFDELVYELKILLKYEYKLGDSRVKVRKLIK